MATPTKFFQETLDELKKVVWPTRQEVMRLTFVVIFISVVVGAYIGGLDYMFTKILQLFVTQPVKTTTQTVKPSTQNIQVKLSPAPTKGKAGKLQ